MTNEEAVSNLDIVENELENKFGGYPYTEEEEILLITLDKARKALEKQIPKKPFSKGHCSNCGIEFDIWNYCPVCGQAIDWGGTQ